MACICEEHRAKGEAPEWRAKGQGLMYAGDMDPLVEKRRRYSIDLYHYTNDQWQGVRKAIE